jgi:hypothetical protein
MKKRPNPKKDINAVNLMVRPKFPGPFVMLRTRHQGVGLTTEFRPLTSEEAARYMPPPLIPAVVAERNAARARAIAYARKHGASAGRWGKYRHTPPARAV